MPRKKHVAFKRTRGASGIRISDSIESEVEASGGQDDSSAEVKIAKKALKLSSLELRAMVKDPLPDALRFAETLSSVVRDNMGHQPAENNSDMAPQPMVSSSRMAQAGGENREAQQNCHHAAASKPDLANRSSAADTFEVYALKKSTCLQLLKHKCSNAASWHVLMHKTLQCALECIVTGILRCKIFLFILKALLD